MDMLDYDSTDSEQGFRNACRQRNLLQRQLDVVSSESGRSLFAKFSQLTGQTSGEPSDQKSRLLSRRFEQPNENDLQRLARHDPESQVTFWALHAEFQQIEIDRVLLSALERETLPDLGDLTFTASVSGFDRSHLEQPIAREIYNPGRKPIAPPRPPGNSRGILQVMRDKRELTQQVFDWQSRVDNSSKQQARLDSEHRFFEQNRCKELARLNDEHDEALASAERKLDPLREWVSELMAGLDYSQTSAVESYFACVLFASIYPAFLPVSHVVSYVGSAAELSVVVKLPEPDVLPTAQSYQVSKDSREPYATVKSETQVSENYRSLVQQVALRTLHELFDSDKHELIKSVSLTITAEAANPATGVIRPHDLLAVAVDRSQFLEIRLARVLPSATLEHLGAKTSPNPYALKEISMDRDIRTA